MTAVGIGSDGGNWTVDEIKRVGAALALIAAPLLLTVGFAIHPAEEDSGAAQLQVIVDNTERWDVAHCLILAGTVLFIPAVLALARLIGGRGAWYGLVGAALAGIGVVFVGALVGADALAPSAFADVPAAQRDGLAPGIQAVIDLKGNMPVVLLFFGLPLGLLVLGIGLLVTRTAPRWSAIFVATGAVVLGVIVGNQVLAVGSALLLVGLGSIGVQELRRGAPAAATRIGERSPATS